MNQVLDSVTFLTNGYLHGIKTEKRALAYFAATVFLSTLGMFWQPNLSCWDRDGFFNEQVKQAWAWVSVVAVLLHLSLCIAFSKGRLSTVLRPFTRYCCATISWMFWINAFRLVSFLFWGYDPSGHIWLLSYGSLFLIEEATAIPDLRLYQETMTREIRRRDPSTRVPVQATWMSELPQDEFRNLRLSFTFSRPVIVAILVVECFVVGAAELMMVGTALHYHAWSEKILASMISTATWYAFYRVYFPRNWPHMPGKELLFPDVQTPN